MSCSLLSAVSLSLQPPTVSSCDGRGQRSGESQGHVTWVISTIMYQLIFLSFSPFSIFYMETLYHWCQRQKSYPIDFGDLCIATMTIIILIIIITTAKASAVCPMRNRAHLCAFERMPGNRLLMTERKKEVKSIILSKASCF